jgi:hypothetical protein
VDSDNVVAMQRTMVPKQATDTIRSELPSLTLFRADPLLAAITASGECRSKQFQDDSSAQHVLNLDSSEPHSPPSHQPTISEAHLWNT